MIIILALAALVIGGLLVVGVVLALIEAVRRLFWLGLRLLAAGVVAVVGVVAVAGAAGTGQEWIGASVLLALGAAVLWLTRAWGQRRMIAPRPAVRSPAAKPPPTVSAANEPDVRPPSLVDPVLRRRLDDTEAGLARAARDDLGAPAAEWLAFWRRRVPDLIAAAQGAHDDAEPVEKPAVAARLAEHLAGILAEADQRIAQVQAARRDRFATLGRHADARVRDG